MAFATHRVTAKVARSFVAQEYGMANIAIVRVFVKRLTRDGSSV
jgi:hypothetical protein